MRRSERYEGLVWRFVEAQHRVSTMKLVDDLDAQETLEALLDETKPPVPEPCRHLNYLLFTPFRYPARHTTRFREKGEVRGVFYAAETLKTAAAEMAFYRLLFFLESPGLTPPLAPMEMTAFSAMIDTDAAWDVSAEDDVALHDLTDYTACHRVAAEARTAGVQAIRYASVRDAGGVNMAVLDCAAFAQPDPLERRSWAFRVANDRVMAMDRSGVERYEFPFAMFAGDPRVGSQPLGTE